jgi:MinD-like ATPase involved in chromosome partitioning or flagellar assembly
MSFVLSWVGIKDGQGVTSSALAVAYELALRHRVIVIDADQSGTGTMIDLLDVDPGQRGMSRFSGRIRAITPSMLEREMVPVSGRPNLRIIPGLNGFCGKPAHALATEMEEGHALSYLPCDFVIMDWGAALAHAGLDSPARAATAICGLSDRVFVQVMDSPVLLTRAVRVLQQARPSKAEVVLLETRPNHLRKEFAQVLSGHLPELGMAAAIPWDHQAAVKSEDHCTTMVRQGRFLAEQLQIEVRARPVLDARQRGLPGPASPRVDL